jgi:hypothetical protein
MSDSPGAPKPWTVLIFMVVDEDAISPYALIDLRDMRRLGAFTGFNLITEVRWHDAAPERYRLTNGELCELEEPRVPTSAGRTAALRQFFADAVRDYPADHYAVMLWGHSYGFGYGRPGFDRVAFQDLVPVFTEFAAQREGRRLEILACNSCRIGKVETVYELHPVVQYMVSSQVGVPFEGWPLRSVFSELVKNPHFSPSELATVMVDKYCEWYRLRTVSMSMLDLAEGAHIVERMEALARALFSRLGDSPAELRPVHEAFVRAANNEENTEPVVDVHELCTHLAELTADPEVKAAATSVREALRSSGFVARHDGTGPGSERLHGLGLFVPHVALDTESELYGKLGLGHARMWTDVVHLLRTTNRHATVLEAVATLEAETWRTSGVL